MKFAGKNLLEKILKLIFWKNTDNNSIDALKSNTSKAPKKGKGVGRKMKKRKKADSSHLNKDDIDNLLDLLIRISDEKGNEKIKEEVNKIIKKS